MKRRHFLLATGALLGAACAPRTRLDPLQRGLDYLESQQQKDGAWRSAHYTDMAGGFELTPMVAKALKFGGRVQSVERALKFLGSEIPERLTYPVYTSALMLMLLPPQLGDLRQRWQEHLLSYQLSPELGWKPQDPEFGGWGYAMRPPARGSGDPMATSNLTSTCFACGALRFAGLKAEDARMQAALTFVERCQHPADGGFFACPGDSVLNKAGPGVSYGSASCDGLRCLHLLGASPERCQQTLGWLEQHFSAQVQPGDFPSSRWEDRDSLYYYYLWSAAHALRSEPRWAPQRRAMREQLVALQSPDGSFRNRLGATREDDPLVATPMALAGLALSGPGR